MCIANRRQRRRTEPRLGSTSRDSIFGTAPPARHALRECTLWFAVALFLACASEVTAPTSTDGRSTDSTSTSEGPSRRGTTVTDEASSEHRPAEATGDFEPGSPSATALDTEGTSHAAVIDSTASEDSESSTSTSAVAFPSSSSEDDGSLESSDEGPGSTPWVEPRALSETGLYADIEAEELAAGVRPYAPTYALWSDGASKRRWAYLPPGTRINNTDERYWIYPAGTKFWKEFTRDGIRVETRLIEKRPDNVWFSMAFLWREDGRDADAVPDGLDDAANTAHDVPSSGECGQCHGGMEDHVLSFTAIQLSHDPADETDPSEWTLERLASEQRLTHSRASVYEIPGNELERAALGYLHANCGHCHNPRSPVPNPSLADFDAWIAPDAASVRDTGPYRTMVGIPSIADLEIDLIDRDDPEASALVRRMSTRSPSQRMPPLATELVDEAGMDTVLTWLRALAAE